jgi:signal transduction histidine kinase
MNRPLHVWLIFGCCLAILLGSMTWATWTALRLEQAEQVALQQAESEERVRLALWRMDSGLSPLIAQESALPYFHYQSFYPAERAYDRMFNELRNGDILVASPLLRQMPTNVLLHFQIAPGGAVTSPQVPVARPGKQTDAALVPAAQLKVSTQRLAQLRTFLRRDQLLARLAPPTQKYEFGNNAFVEQVLVQNRSQAPNPPPAQQMDIVSANSAQQVARNVVELQARAQNYKQAAQSSYDNTQQQGGSAGVGSTEAQPCWLGSELLLVRRANVNGGEYLQGSWLDWPGIRHDLLAQIRDLLPEARLEPLNGTVPDSHARLLAALPVQLLPGPLPGTSSVPVSTTSALLVTAWLGVLLAAVAVAILLHGTISLSERRATFVSAVTHELRTPLTTFRMYSEMLAEDMVPDPAKRKAYLQTLCAEAIRLGHLVENVLAYARVERGSARRQDERIRLGELVERVRSRLEQHCAQAGLQLVVDADPQVAGVIVRVDLTAVEQILFNLVDNACKYAAPGATEKIVHLEALPHEQFAMLRVRDHGQGVNATDVRRLFRPFHKSAHEAAKTAPGIGLGLALCRRLSRSMGGDLRLGRQRPGASFELLLPRQAA